MASPRAVAKLLDTAMHRHRAGEVAQAEALYRRVVEKDSANGKAWYGLSVLAMQATRYEEVVELLGRAIRCEPRNAIYYSNLGEAHRRLGRRLDAIASFREAVAAKPDLAEAHYNLGLALDGQGQITEALQSYETAVQLKPELLGVVAAPLVAALRDVHRFDEAIAAFNQLSARVPASGELHRAVAVALASIFRFDEARAHFVRAVELDPASSGLHADYGGALLDSGYQDEAIAEFRRAVELKPDDHVAHSNLVFAMSFHPAYDDGALRDEAALWCRRHASPFTRARRHSNVRDPERPLRVGYVSADFRQHSVSYFVLPLFRHHDRANVRTYCYSNARIHDHVSEQIESVVDEWRAILPMTDEAVTRMIEEDEIDILVDLSMHSGNNRLLVFARKPAPVQVSWLAYPGTTGVGAIDYRVTDPWFDPPSSPVNRGYAERALPLPDTFWCYDPLGDGPSVNPLPALQAGHVTFGCLNNFRKAGEASLSLWARALHAVKDSRMILVAPLGKVQGEILQRFESHGIARERIEFVAQCSHADYLALFNRLDWSLDPLPFCGGTTSLDSFWMGVPVITAVGRTVAGRGGLSLAGNLGLLELVAESPEKFGQVTADLCRDLERLSGMRQTLRARLQASPLMDASRFARHLEEAYRTIWRRWCGETARAESAGLQAPT